MPTLGERKFLFGAPYPQKQRVRRRTKILASVSQEVRFNNDAMGKFNIAQKARKNVETLLRKL